MEYIGWFEIPLYSQHLPAEEVAGKEDRRLWWRPFPTERRWTLFPPKDLLSFRVGSWKNISIQEIWGSWSLWLYDCILASKVTFCSPKLLLCFLLKEKQANKTKSCFSVTYTSKDQEPAGRAAKHYPKKHEFSRSSGFCMKFRCASQPRHIYSK